MTAAEGAAAEIVARRRRGTLVLELVLFTVIALPVLGSLLNGGWGGIALATGGLVAASAVSRSMSRYVAQVGHDLPAGVLARALATTSTRQPQQSQFAAVQPRARNVLGELCLGIDAASWLPPPKFRKRGWEDVTVRWPEMRQISWAPSAVRTSGPQEVFCFELVDGNVLTFQVLQPQLIRSTLSALPPDVVGPST